MPWSSRRRSTPVRDAAIGFFAAPRVLLPAAFVAAHVLLPAGLTPLSPILTSAATTVREADVVVSAVGLPEFKTDPHVEESQGNQISGVVRDIFQDSRGQMWFGTQNGLARYDGSGQDGSSLSYFELHDSFGRRVTIKSIAEAPDGGLWIGMTGGVTKYDGQAFTIYDEDDGLRSEDVWSVCVDRTGLLWVGTYAGVDVFDGSTFTPFDLPEGTPDPDKGITSPHIVWHIMEDSQSRIWFAAEGAVFTYDGTTVSRVPMVDEESVTYIGSMMEDRSGDVWFGTTKGLLRYDGDAIVNVTASNGLHDVAAGAVHVDRSGNIWFSAHGRAVYRYDGSSFTNFSEGQGVAMGVAMCIAEDDQGRIWCGGFGVRSGSTATRSSTRRGAALGSSAHWIVIESVSAKQRARRERAAVVGPTGVGVETDPREADGLPFDRDVEVLRVVHAASGPRSRLG